MVNLLPNQKLEKKEISPYYRARDCTIDDLPTPGSAQAMPCDAPFNWRKPPKNPNPIRTN